MATESDRASRTTTTSEGACEAGARATGATGEGGWGWRWGRRVVMGLASAIVALYVVGVTASVGGEENDGRRAAARGEGGPGVETARVAAPTSARVAYVPQPGAKGARYRDR